MTVNGYRIQTMLAEVHTSNLFSARAIKKEKCSCPLLNFKNKTDQIIFLAVIQHTQNMKFPKSKNHRHQVVTSGSRGRKSLSIFPLIAPFPYAPLRVGIIFISYVRDCGRVGAAIRWDRSSLQWLRGRFFYLCFVLCFLLCFLCFFRCFGRESMVSGHWHDRVALTSHRIYICYIDEWLDGWNDIVLELEEDFWY